MAWSPNANTLTEGQGLRIVKGEAGKEVHSGSRALHVKADKTRIHITNSGARGKGGFYKFRFFARGKGKLGIHTYEYTAGSMGHGVIGDYYVTPEWKEYTGTYRPSDKADQGWVFYLEVFPGADATVDDFEMWEGERPANGDAR